MKNYRTHKSSLFLIELIFSYCLLFSGKRCMFTVICKISPSEQRNNPTKHRCKSCNLHRRNLSPKLWGYGRYSRFITGTSATKVCRFL